MFGRILYISDNVAYVQNNTNNELEGDLLNLHLIFEYGDEKILGEIYEVHVDHIQVRFLGQFSSGKFYSGVIRKPNLKSNIRVINGEELQLLVGTSSKENMLLGECATYKGFKVYPKINDLFANHMCIFGNSGSGKSCGVARIIQNVLSNPDAVTYNANLIFFDSFGEYKNAFKNINTINEYYNYRFLTLEKKDDDDEILQIPLNLLTVDDLAVLLQADKHSQLTILERTLKYVKIFAVNSEESNKYKNNIIARAILTIMYSNNITKQKKDDIFKVIDTCHTPEFNYNTVIEGLGYSRTFSECFILDQSGKFGEEVLINDYVLKFINDEIEEFEVPADTFYTLNDLAKALEFTLISEGFTQNKNMHDDAQLLKVRLNTILHNEIGKIFIGDKYYSRQDFINNLVTIKGKKAQIINISLESVDDANAKALVKIYARLIFEYCKNNSNRATVPFHLFLEEAHRYIQRDNDVFLLGYNIFERISKEGRKYGTLINVISQRPVEISETVTSQCSNFFIFKMNQGEDIKYIEQMLPNVSHDIIEKMKILQPGTCVAFGSAFKIPMIVKMEMPSPSPYSSSCDVSHFWDAQSNFTNLDTNNVNNDISSDNLFEENNAEVEQSDVNLTPVTEDNILNMEDNN